MAFGLKEIIVLPNEREEPLRKGGIELTDTQAPSEPTEHTPSADPGNNLPIAKPSPSHDTDHDVSNPFWLPGSQAHPLGHPLRSAGQPTRAELGRSRALGPSAPPPHVEFSRLLGHHSAEVLSPPHQAVISKDRSGDGGVGRESRSSLRPKDGPCPKSPQSCSSPRSSVAQQSPAGPSHAAAAAPDGCRPT